MIQKLDRKMRRYHHKIYFPKNTGKMCLDFFAQFDEINVTHHAAQELLEDKRGIIPFPNKKQLMHPNNQLVEFYEILDKNKPSGKMQKALIRIRNLSNEYDYCYVIAREGFIVSAWANDKDDNHRLTTANYYSPNSVTKK